MKQTNKICKLVRFKVLVDARRFAAITGSTFRIESYPLLASSQHVGATTTLKFLLFMLFEQTTTLANLLCLLES